MQPWLKKNRIKTNYIERMSPWQKGVLDSIRGRFRDKCLNRMGALWLTVAQLVVGDYRQQYNEVKPHDRLGHESLAIFVARIVHSHLRPGCALRWEWTMTKQKRKTELGLTAYVEQKVVSGHCC
jgi:hypothetical protein